MVKRRLYIWITLSVLIILSVLGYGSFRLQRQRTHSDRVDKAVTRIVAALDADPNYVVTTGGILRTRPLISSEDRLLYDFLNPLNVGISIAVSKGPPSWAIRLDKAMKRLPTYLRPNPGVYLRHKEHKSIIITVVEGTQDDLLGLKRKVDSIRLSHDIHIKFWSYFPEIEHNQIMEWMALSGRP